MQTADRLIRLREVCRLVGAARATTYTWRDPKSPQYDPTFPRPVKLGQNSVAFSWCEIQEWIEQRKSARQTGTIDAATVAITDAQARSRGNAEAGAATRA